MIGDYYTWAEFKSAVRELLTVDRDRIGLQDTTDDAGNTVPGYITLMIRQAVIDLQRFIPVFRKDHETLYYPSDFVTEGYASRGVLPPGAEVQDAYLYHVETNSRFPLDVAAWEGRHNLTGGLLALDTNVGRLIIEPDAYKFYVYPCVTDQWVLSLNWNALLDGGKSDFEDDELVPFPEDATLAVKEFVKGHITREINKDLPGYATYFHPKTGTYSVARRNLFLTANDRRRGPRFRGLLANRGGCSDDTMSSRPTTSEPIKEVFHWPGDPTGKITPKTADALCIDTVNHITWQWYDGSWTHDE